MESLLQSKLSCLSRRVTCCLSDADLCENNSLVSKHVLARSPRILEFLGLLVRAEMNVKVVIKPAATAASGKAAEAVDLITTLKFYAMWEGCASDQSISVSSDTDWKIRHAVSQWRPGLVQ